MHEEIIFTGNIGEMVAGTPDYNKAVDSLRRLGARMQATNITALSPLRWCLSKAGYDLVKAGGGLIGLSNSLADDGWRAQHTNSIQVALKLPRDYLDEYLRAILKQTQEPHLRP